MPTVDQILNAAGPFTDNRRLKMKLEGRPTPSFRFDGPRQCRLQQQYDTTAWLCGCPIRKAFFCFPCLLFKNKQSAWSNEGVKDLKNLTNKVRKHVRSQLHISASVSYSLLDTLGSENAVSDGLRTSRALYNREVAETRELLKHHIMAAVFLVTQGLPLRGLTEADESLGGGNFVELLRLLAYFSGNKTLKSVMGDGPSAFSGLSADVQDDIIYSMHSLVLQKIKERAQSAQFMSLMIDEITELSNSAQLALSVRVMEEGHVYEHLIDIVDVPVDRRSASLFLLIRESLEKTIGITPVSECRLLSASCDGNTRSSFVQKLIRDEWSTASSVPSYSHKWHLIVRKACGEIPDVVYFFGFLDHLLSFFRLSPKRAEALSVLSALPGEVKWLSRGKILTLMCFKYDEVISALEFLESNDLYDFVTRDEARSLLQKMRNINNVFFMYLFKKLLDLSRGLTKELGRICLNPSDVEKRAEEYKSKVTALRSELEFQNIYSLTKSHNPEIPTQTSGQSLQDEKKYSSVIIDEVNGRITLQNIMFDVIDKLIAELSARFDDFERFEWVRLFDPKNFEFLKADSFTIISSIQTLNKLHPGLFEDTETLRTQLNVLYANIDITTALHSAGNNENTFQLLESLTSLKLNDALPELYTTLSLAVTYPLTSIPPDRKSSVLKRLKTFTRSSAGNPQSKYSVLLNVEAGLLRELSESPDFCDKVINIFAALKDRQVNLTYIN